MKRNLALLAALLVVFGFLSPGDYYTNFATRILIAALLALSLNILVGYGGLISLGHSAFFGIAAYALAWFSLQEGWNHLAAIGAALALTVAVAAVFGALALRAQGIGFLMITLALGQITWGLALRWIDVTGGDNGVTGLTRPMPFGFALEGAQAFYGLVGITFLVACALLQRFVSSPFGASLRGTREQPRRMSALGYDVWKIRWLSFIAAAFLAGIAGILDAYHHKFISPHTLSLTESATVLLMVIVGGSGTLFGPVLGAAIVLVFSEAVSSSFEHWHAALGMLYLAVVLGMPEGIAPALQAAWRRAAARLARVAPDTVRRRT